MFIRLSNTVDNVNKSSLQTDLLTDQNHSMQTVLKIPVNAIKLIVMPFN